MFVFQVKLWKFNAFKIASFQVTATRFDPTTTYFVNKHPTIEACLATWLNVCLQIKWLWV